MKIAPVYTMPVSRIPSNIGIKDHKDSLFLDEEAFKKVKKGSGCAESVSMTEIRLCGCRPSFKFSSINLDNYAISRVVRSYGENHNKNRGFKTLLEWIVDTLV